MTKNKKAGAVFLSCVVLIAALAVFLSFFPIGKSAGDTAATGTVRIMDKADLLTDAEERKLSEVMQNAALYGNMCFVTVPSSFKREYISDAESELLTQTTFRSLYGYDSATLVSIDMRNRYIYIFSDGDLYKKYITSSRAREITDNAYTYATDGDYYGCAEKIFQQIEQVQHGGSIFSPIKIVNNLLLSFSVSLTVVCFIVYKDRTLNSRLGKRAAAPETDAVHVISKVMTKNTVTRITSGSGGGFHGGGSRGGGHSGGGGGHHF